METKFLNYKNSIIEQMNKKNVEISNDEYLKFLKNFKKSNLPQIQSFYIPTSSKKLRALLKLILKEKVKTSFLATKHMEGFQKVFTYFMNTKNEYVICDNKKHTIKCKFTLKNKFQYLDHFELVFYEKGNLIFKSNFFHFTDWKKNQNFIQMFKNNFNRINNFFSQLEKYLQTDKIFIISKNKNGRCNQLKTLIIIFKSHFMRFYLSKLDFYNIIKYDKDFDKLLNDINVFILVDYFAKKFFKKKS